MKQNITLAIEKPILKQAREVAVRRGRSVSALLAEELRKLVKREAAYNRARAKALAHLNSPFHLGGAGIANRAELHDRESLR